MPVLRRRRGRRPKIDKLLEASALESMIAANSGAAASLAGSLTSAGLSGGLNMLWPMPGFEQCLSRLADASMAERSRLLHGESGQAASHDDVQQTSNTLTGGEHEDQPSKSVASETSVGGVDLRALLTKEVWHQPTTSRPADEEPGDASATTAEECHDSQSKDVSASHVSDADLRKDSRARDADVSGMKLADRTPRKIGEHRSAAHDHVDEPAELPLKLTAGMADCSKDVSMSETLSRDASRHSAAEEDEDLTSRLRGSDDVVARWLAEHRNTFDRQGLEDEVQSEVI